MAANLEAYKVFLAVAQTGSFSKGGEKLHITQPAVSQTISSLEAQLGMQLFIRSSKGVTLSAEGQLLLEHVAYALSILQNGEEKLAKIAKLEAGSLHIGASDTITKQFLLPFIQKFHLQYPQVKIQLTNRTSPQLIELLKQGLLDIAIVNLPLSEPTLKIISCERLQDVFVASKAYVHLLGKTLSLAEIASLPLIMLEKQANSRRFVDSFFAENGIHLAPEIELGAYDLLQEFAKIDLGIACVTSQFSKQAIADGELFELTLAAPIPQREMGICRLADIEPSSAAKAFARLVTTQKL